MSGTAGRSSDALSHARTIQADVAVVGFDWPSAEGPIAKVREEIAEVEEALGLGDLDSAKRELGDVLFAVVNLSRFLDADPADELSLASERFMKRFSRLETEVIRSGRRVEECSLEELDDVWDQIKQGESST